MSITYASTKRNRVYKRKFDHEEMRTLYAAGATQASLAKKYGVHVNRIVQLVNPRIGHDVDRRARAYMRRTHHHCPNCGAVVTQASVYNDKRRGRTRPNGICGHCDRWGRPRPGTETPPTRSLNTILDDLIAVLSGQQQPVAPSSKPLTENEKRTARFRKQLETGNYLHNATGYRVGCRCDECRAAKTIYDRSMAAKKRTA